MARTSAVETAEPSVKSATWFDAGNRRSGWVGVSAVLGTFAIVSATISIVFWPGLMDADTLGEFQQAATGKFTDWHTPILSALWRIPYLLGLKSPGWVLFIGVFTLLVGFYLVLRVRFSRCCFRLDQRHLLSVSSHLDLGSARGR